MSYRSLAIDQVEGRVRFRVRVLVGRGCDHRSDRDVVVVVAVSEWSISSV